MTLARPSSPVAPRAPVVLLLADTGSGHRSAALAVAEALESTAPGRFAPVLLDPLGGPSSARLLRRVVGLYGPVIRLAPWLWGAIYYLSDRPSAATALQRTLLRLADGPVADVTQRLHPSAIVSFHALTTGAAVRAARRPPHDVPVITVVTDLVTAHTTWRQAGVDQIVVPSASVGKDCRLAGVAPDQCTEIGLPVAAQFCGGRLPSGQRAALKRELGVDEGRFLVVVAGGGEGAGGIAKRVAALVDAFDDVQLVAICGRNQRLVRALGHLAKTAGGRVVVKGFVTDMVDWLHCADAVVTKAGPGTIAEATCCGAPLVITSRVPGQEQGNTELVVGAGAARHAPRVKDLLSTIGELTTQPIALEAMREASASLGRPTAASEIAALIARMADPRSSPSTPRGTSVESMKELTSPSAHFLPCHFKEPRWGRVTANL